MVNLPSLVGAGAGAWDWARAEGEKIRKTREKTTKNPRKDLEEPQIAILFLTKFEEKECMLC